MSEMVIVFLISENVYKGTFPRYPFNVDYSKYQFLFLFYYVYIIRKYLLYN